MTAPNHPDLNELKRRAAIAACAHVTTGMIVGLGTGSTAILATRALAQRMSEEGLTFLGIPTSEATATEANRLRIPLTDLGTHPVVDLTIDGADAVDRNGLHLIKGLGGALLREKIVAFASKRLCIIVDHTKLADPFGSACPVPVEVVRFGWQATGKRLTDLGAAPHLRLGLDGQPFVTDGGNFIIDCRFGTIDDPASLAADLKALTGVVDTGLFINLATDVIIAAPDGLETLRR